MTFTPKKPKADHPWKSNGKGSVWFPRGDEEDVDVVFQNEPNPITGTGRISLGNGGFLKKCY